MKLDALVFGSLGTITETSDLHRQSFNQAFNELGLEWEWSMDTYARLLETAAGTARILAFARENGDTSVTETTALELHQHKTKVYAGLVRSAGSVLRPGVMRLITEATEAGLPVGLATSTSLDSIESNLANGPLTLEHFQVVTTIDQLDRPKPAPDAHVVCMSRLGVSPARTIAIEDTRASVASAYIAGAKVVATPGAFGTDPIFSSAAVVVPSLDNPLVTLDWLTALL